MNIFHKYTKVLALGMTVVASAMFTSCEDEPDKYEATGGVPVVKYIRCLQTEIVGTDDAEDMHYTNGELVTSAGPGNTICLVGSNLRSVYEIYFNDLSVNPNPSYITDNTLIVSVPANVPSKVTDKMYLITKSKDTIDVDFHVSIPAPSVMRMENEYATVGSVQRISGNYFINDPGTPLTVEFTGAGGAPVKAEIAEIDPEYTWIDVVIPNGAAPGPVNVTSVYGKSKSAFQYLDNRGMLFDFDTPNSVTNTVLGNHGWHNMVITSDESSLSGNYLQLGDGNTEVEGAGEAWSWLDGQFSFEYWAGGSWSGVEDYGDAPRLIDLVNFTDWQNMSLKFEMYIPDTNPWSACALQIIPAAVSEITGGGAATDIYGVAVPGANNTFFNGTPLPRALYRPWTETGSYDTGNKWVTVTIPFTSFIYNENGEKSSVGLSKDSFSSLTFFLWKGGVDGTPCHPIIKIDNIRAVPNK